TLLPSNSSPMDNQDIVEWLEKKRILGMRLNPGLLGDCVPSAYRLNDHAEDEKKEELPPVEGNLMDDDVSCTFQRTSLLLQDKPNFDFRIDPTHPDVVNLYTQLGMPIPATASYESSLRSLYTADKMEIQETSPPSPHDHPVSRSLENKPTLASEQIEGH
ncbi:hypothetical protein PMAYCL1PPCAC_30333, partial [Pristionchus mayeri]